MHLLHLHIRSPAPFRLTDVNNVKHDSKHQRPSFRFIHITSEQPIHIVGISKKATPSFLMLYAVQIGPSK